MPGFVILVFYTVNMPPKLLTIADGPCWVLNTGSSVRAGFPSLAEDHGVQPINLHSLLIPHPQATYMMRVSGRSMEEAGLFDGDYVLVDRAVRPEPGHIVVGVIDNDMTIKYLRRSAGGVYYLESSDLTFPKLYAPKEGTLQVWGVSRTAIRPMPGFSIRA